LNRNTGHALVESIWIYVQIKGLFVVENFFSNGIHVCFHVNQALFKGAVHPQKIFFKYVMLRTVTQNSTITIMKYT